MSKRVQNNRSSGFSFVETLAATAILVILLSLSAVAVTYYRGYLKITELDNAAREIYMAAENRAVLLSGGKQLGQLVEAESRKVQLSDASAPDAGEGASLLAAPETKTGYYIRRGAAELKELLPGGSIDPALLEGDFYIVYEPVSGSVTDVFYSEQPLDSLLSENTDFQGFYNRYTPPSSDAAKNIRMRLSPMLGYYGGGMSDNTNYTPLPSPEVMVVIRNGERLTVDVTFQIPKTALDLMGPNWENNAKRLVTLEYLHPDGQTASQKVTLFGAPEPDAPFAVGRPMSVRGNLASGSVTYTWVLDSLEYTLNAAGKKEFNQRFCQLFGGSGDFGGDFRVNAEIELSAKGYKSTSAKGSDTNNSLFAMSSGGEAARIECLRHLQNLDQSFSMVSGKTTALQIADIHCYDNTVYSEYEFIPIENSELSSYSGGWSAEKLPDGTKRRNEIQSLRVTEDSSAGKTAAGLFSTTKDGTAEAPTVFSGIRLIDAEITSSKPAGALAGNTGKYNTFTDVRISGASVNASGTAAGGVAGTVGNHTDFNEIHIINSAVGSATEAPEYSGGVAGYIGSPENSGSVRLYDCWVYWEAEAGEQNLRHLLVNDDANESYRYQVIGNYAGGLVGRLELNLPTTEGTTPAEIRSCLSATMVDGKTAAGGLIGSVSGGFAGNFGGILYYNYGSLRMSGSYADCYLTGKAAAGLIGNAYSEIKASDCYAAGFIDMAKAETAAGLCLSADAKVTTHRCYSAMYYAGRNPDESYKNRIFELTQTQSLSNNDSFYSTYYLNTYQGEGSVGSSGAEAQPLAYPDMTSHDFAIDLGSSFAFKAYKTDEAKQNTYPYNLQERQNLTAYSFPGLAGLPHYGDWRAEFKEPSLVYYEQYSDGSYGFSGGNARYLVGQLEDRTVRTDGYSVALLRSDLTVNADGAFEPFSIRYTFLDASTQTKREITISYSNTSQFLPAEWEREEGGQKKTEYYYLLPLPEELIPNVCVPGELGPDISISNDFYQYLRFDFSRKVSSGSENSPSGEYFYNPHFAETVNPYAPGSDTPLINWSSTSGEEAAAQIKNHITDKLIPSHNVISVNVRTPRHFYALSKCEEYYHNNVHSLAFQQTLDLDYSAYDFSAVSGSLPIVNGFAAQLPVGHQTAPFRGSYDGGCNFIQNVVFQKPENDNNRICAGLFGYSTGTLKNIVYKMDPEKALPFTFPSSEKETYLGALVGVNSAGTVENCAVEGVNLSVHVFDSHVYIGGLAGLNNGTIRNCAAELSSLFVDASNHAEAYAGGLTGWNQSVLGISTSYSVGRISANASETTAPIFLCGFTGRNSGAIRNSYTAMDLRPDGAGASAYSFCGRTDGSGRQSGTSYLNQGNFTYRDISFVADYPSDNGGALPLRYSELTASGSVAGMDFNKGVSPYPTAVKNAGGVIHYGQYPKPMELGEMGVYYWEELEINGKTTYHVNLLAVDPNQKTIDRQSTLSTAHDDRGVVTRYGYGCYSEKNRGISLASSGLLYSADGQEEREFTDTLFKELEANKAANPTQPDKQVDVQLALLMDGFDFHSFHSFGLNKPLGGLYPNSDPNTPNCTLTLTQNGASEAENVSVTFTLNPLFANALSVEYPSVKNPSEKQWGPKPSPDGGTPNPNSVPFETKTSWPGSAENPYGVRSIEQLELINWNTRNRDTRTRIMQNTNIVQFPYLSSSSNTGKYHWEQSHDIMGEKKPNGDYETYTPIAEYYDNVGGGTGDLYGWFGGTYNGGNYVIENVNIEGQQSSCAGLFGVVYDGSLDSIILYSSDGNGLITTRANEAGSKTQSRWYAMGALAGVAGTRDPNSNAISNCSAAGYTLRAEVYTHSQKMSDGSVDGWGGSNIGGLVGASHMNLSNCSAIVDIEVQNAEENDNMRVGGLVGACQGNVTNCYAGGSISIQKETVILKRDNRGIYIGGLVAGTYMKPLRISGKNNQTIGFADDPGAGKGNTEGYVDCTLSNCYSFVRLPAYVEYTPTAANAYFHIKGIFAVGGAGEIEKPNVGTEHNHGTCTIKNCYYLGSETLYHNSGDENAIIQRGIKTDMGSANSIALGNSSNFTVSTVLSKDNTPSSTLVTGYYIRSGSTEGVGAALFSRTEQRWNNAYTFAGWLIQTEGGQWELTVNRDDPRFKTFTRSADPTGLTYEQLTGELPIGDKTIYQLLNLQNGTDEEAREKGPFRPVTVKTAEGNPVPGKYSYPPDTSPELKGRDFPFPTILTRESKAFCVHYGRWPVNGFQRQAMEPDETGKPVYLGGAPIQADLFVSAEYKEHLVLTEKVSAGGTWNLSSGDPLIASPSIISPDVSNGENPKTFTLAVTSQSIGSTALDISYTVDGVTYSRSISVHVTADVELQPSKVFLFPSDEVTVSIKPANKMGSLLEEGGSLELSSNPACGSDQITAQKVQHADTAPGILFTSKNAPAGPAMASASFVYTSSAGKPYPSAAPIHITVLELPQPVYETTEGGQKICTLTFGDFPVSDEAGAAPDTLTFLISEAELKNRYELGAAAPSLEVNGNALKLIYPTDETPELELSVTLTMSSLNHKLIPEDEPQIHALTLTVQKPADEASVQANIQPVEALVPENRQDDPERRRRWRKCRRETHAPDQKP